MRPYGLARPDLLPVDAVDVRGAGLDHAYTAGSQRREIRTGVRFAETLTPQLVRRQQARQMRALLFFAAEQADGVGDVIDRRDGRYIGRAELVVENSVVDQ